ncbi:hypothetical protein QGM71_01195 [Virgibacillus sp. C22-A2]|uniref:Uncharacterized protein n=1 Tax=Virgibacillus tibetensis TaxID=3042313 RepID=A0ABU6KAE2_9BACI|nr:hypothetical protein [Virgibacillus sp. C22-A2]
MKTSHEDYLKQTLQSKKYELEHLNTQHRIDIAVYNAKKRKGNNANLLNRISTRRKIAKHLYFLHTN